MIETITKYYCDNCKQEVKDLNKDLTKVNLSMKLDETRGPSFNIEICEPCMKELGFIETTERNYISNYNHALRNSLSIIKSLFGGNKHKPK